MNQTWYFEIPVCPKNQESGTPKFTTVVYDKYLSMSNQKCKTIGWQLFFQFAA